MDFKNYDMRLVLCELCCAQVIHRFMSLLLKPMWTSHIEISCCCCCCFKGWWYRVERTHEFLTHSRNSLSSCKTLSSISFFVVPAAAVVADAAASAIHSLCSRAIFFLFYSVLLIFFFIHFSIKSNPGAAVIICVCKWNAFCWDHGEIKWEKC